MAAKKKAVKVLKFSTMRIEEPYGSPMIHFYMDEKDPKPFRFGKRKAMKIANALREHGEKKFLKMLDEVIAGGDDKE